MYFEQDRPFWSDEAYLLMSVLHRDFGALLREPLEYGQVAPLLFVCWQRLAFEFFTSARVGFPVVSLTL